MTMLQAILLGVVQGITEFLPISSSGHLSIFQNLFDIDTGAESNVFFDVLLHLGTLVSVCVAYREDIWTIITDTFAFVQRAGHPVPGGDKQRFPGARLLLMMVIATLPLAVVLPIKGQIEKLYDNTMFIGIALILTGCMLFLSDRMPRGRKNEKTMSILDAALVGVSQAVATVPGLSRSGTTITAGMAVGLDRQFAVKYSFLISIPAILGANLLSLIEAVQAGIDTKTIPLYLVGMLVAMVVGYLAIWMVRYIVNKGRFGYFAYYCGLAGLITIILTIVR